MKFFWSLVALVAIASTVDAQQKRYVQVCENGRCKLVEDVSAPPATAPKVDPKSVPKTESKTPAPKVVQVQIVEPRKRGLIQRLRSRFGQ